MERYDSWRLLGRNATGRARPRDLGQMGATLKQLPPMLNDLVSCQSNLLVHVRENIDPHVQLCELLDTALVDECPLTTRDGGMIRAGYDCLLFTSPIPRDPSSSRMPSSA